MIVDITCKHMDITDALREHTESRVAKAFEHVLEPPNRCHVILDHVRHSHSAEFVVRHLGKTVAASGTAQANMYTAIDTAAGRLRRQLDDASKKKINS